MQIDRANVGTEQRAANIERTQAQHGTDIKRIMRRLPETKGPDQPAQTPGDDGSDLEGTTLWGTTSKSVSRGTTAITVTITLGGTGTRTAIEGGLMTTGDTLASGALVVILLTAGVWRIINADCDQIT